MRSSSPSVAAIASDRKTLLVNRTASPISLRLNGAPVRLNGYEVRVIDRPAQPARVAQGKRTVSGRKKGGR